MHARGMHVLSVPSDVGDFADDVRRVFAELGRRPGAESSPGECVPPVDVYETDDAVEIVIDLPGITRDTVRVVARHHTLLVVGEKPPRRSRGDSTFHLVERSFGRFARTIPLARACDTARARAVLVDGELRITVPKVPERRGSTIDIPIT